AEDAELMVAAGVNVVRMGEFTWGVCEREEGKYDFEWFKRAMDVMQKAGIKVVLGTPTAAPPIWLTKKYPEILPIDERGRTRGEGRRRACCLNRDVYWYYPQASARAVAPALGKHEQLTAWKIDTGLGGHLSEFSLNEQTRRDWHAWLEAKYEKIEKLN